MDNINKSVIIVAGGKGERMHASVPKQFMLVRNKPILMHTIEKFFCFDNSMQVVLVLPAEHIQTWNKLCKEYNFTISHTIVTGGNNRFESVGNGLSVVNKDNFVAVHDGVRPFVSVSTIKKCFEMAESTGTAIPVLQLTDSIRQVNSKTSKAVPRSEYRLVQTPQVFNYSILTESYNQAFSELFTDDASVVESMGYSINLVEGNSENIKITTQVDLQIAEVFAKIIE